MKRYILPTLVALALLAACKEEPLGQPATDGSAPAPVTGVSSTRLPGGAVIRYDLPDDPDMLYVMAEYSRAGEQRDVKASVYTNTLRVEGFGDTLDHPVRLVSVDRSGNASSPVSTSVRPLPPPIWGILESFSVVPDFGGVKVAWQNENRAEVSIYLMAQDSTGTLAERDVIYTSVASGAYSLRGLDTLPRDFGLYVRDRWGNLSDTLVTREKPLFELELDRTAYRMHPLPADNTTDINAYGFTFLNMFDGVINQDFNGWHSNSYITKPTYLTIDLGRTVILSRMKLWHRGGDYFYAHYNPRKWEVWGTDDLAYAPSDVAYWQQGGAWESDGHWTFLQEYEVEKPSGKEITEEATNEDLEFARAGFESNFPVPGVPVRYIRICVTETCSGSTDVHIGEIRFWGQPVN